MNHAFAPNIKEAFDGSVSLVKEMSVSDGEILDSSEKIIAYFVD